MLRVTSCMSSVQYPALLPLAFSLLEILGIQGMQTFMMSFYFHCPDWKKKKKKNNSMNWKLSKNFLLQFHQIMSMLLIVRVEITHKLKVLQWWNENHTKKRESRSWDCEWFIVLINIKLCPLYSESRVAGNHNRNNKLSI